MYSEMNNSVGCAVAGTAYSATRHTATCRNFDLMEIMLRKLLIGGVTVTITTCISRRQDISILYPPRPWPQPSRVLIHGQRPTRPPDSPRSTFRQKSPLLLLPAAQSRGLFPRRSPVLRRSRLSSNAAARSPAPFLPLDEGRLCRWSAAGKQQARAR